MGLWCTGCQRGVRFRIQECSLGLQDGITLIEDILADTGHGSYRNRYNLKTYLSGNHESDPGVIGSGIVGPENSQDLQTVDIMKWLPSLDVDDMRDFFDKMSDSERRRWTSGYAVNCMLKTLIYNSMYA